VILFHSRFTARRRAKLEEEVVARTGKLSRKKERDRTVIIGTQVIEQSLDLDFDLLITDLCPMDLLLQRIGRMHRHGLHDPIRPESLKNPVCYVLAPDGRWDKGTGKIYNHWILKQTLEALPEKIEISRDIPVLVESVYGISDSSLEHEEYLSQQEKSRRKANAYRMAAPVASRRKKTVKTYFTNMLENDEEGKKAVRDSAFSTEVILVRKNENGEYFLLSDTEQKNPILSYNEPDSFQIRGLLLDKVSLPSWVFATEALGFINELEKIRDTEFFVWKDTGALKGELFIPLDENGQAQTEKFKISYNDETGLHVYKKGSEMDGQGI
jgi:CRISPR-associated endonuclease/helicase Cas3